MRDATLLGPAFPTRSLRNYTCAGTNKKDCLLQRTHKKIQQSSIIVEHTGLHLISLIMLVTEL